MNCKQSEIRTINFADPADKARHNELYWLTEEEIATVEEAKKNIAEAIELHISALAR